MIFNRFDDAILKYGPRLSKCLVLCLENQTKKLPPLLLHHESRNNKRQDMCTREYMYIHAYTSTHLCSQSLHQQSRHIIFTFFARSQVRPWPWPWPCESISLRYAKWMNGLIVSRGGTSIFFFWFVLVSPFLSHAHAHTHRSIALAFQSRRVWTY